MYLNGERRADGPARTAKGYCRVDEFTVRLSGEIHVAFEVLAMDFPEKYSNDCTLEPGLLAVEITGADGSCPQPGTVPGNADGLLTAGWMWNG